MRHLATIVCATLLLLPRLACAQPAGMAASLQAFQSTPAYAGLMRKAFASLPPQVYRHCPALKAGTSALLILRPITFGPNNTPLSGEWTQGFPVSGCGNDTTLNFHFFVLPTDKTLHVILTAPGSTRADPILQRDALGYAITGAGLTIKGCKNFAVLNTHFDHFGLDNPATPDPGPAARFRPWQESWTMSGCGGVANVPISFLPNAGGTQIITVVKH